jgi:hypothetical protein
MISYHIKPADIRANHHLGNHVAKHERKVEEQYQDLITRQVLPSMTLDIHVVEVGMISYKIL